jgi:hypothetical protein
LLRIDQKTHPLHPLDPPILRGDAVGVTVWPRAAHDPGHKKAA